MTDDFKMLETEMALRHDGTPIPTISSVCMAPACISATGTLLILTNLPCYRNGQAPAINEHLHQITLSTM